MLIRDENEKFHPRRWERLVAQRNHNSSTICVINTWVVAILEHSRQHNSPVRSMVRKSIAAGQSVESWGLPVMEMPQAVLADWVYSAIFRNFDCSQMTRLKKHAAIQIERAIVDD